MQLGGHRCGSNAGRCRHRHARITIFELLDLSVILAIGYQLALLSDKSVTITQFGVNPHQLKTQITALGLPIDRSLEQYNGLAQLTLLNQPLGLIQHISRRLGQGNRRDHRSYCLHDRCRCRCRCRIDTARRRFKPLKTALRQIQIGCKPGLIFKIPSHSRMFLCFLQRLAPTHEQQQQEQQQDRPAADKPQ